MTKRALFAGCVEISPAGAHFLCRLLVDIGKTGLDESLGYIKGPSATAPVTNDIAARDFPAIMAVGPFFSQKHHESTFAAGLETLLAELAREAKTLGNG